MQKLSYLSSPRTTPYRYCTVFKVLSDLAISHPQKEIIICRRTNGDRHSITYKDLDDKSSLLARYLHGAGASRISPVSIYGPNTIEWVIGELAVMKTSSTCVHLSLGTKNADDAMDILQTSNSRLLIADPGLDMEWRDTIKTLESRLQIWNKDNSDRSIQMVMLRKCPDFPNVQCLEDILALNLQTDLPDTYPEDLAVVFTTSGTTGHPKLVAMSHFSFVNISENVDAIIKLDQRAFNDRPFAWLGGSPFLYLTLGITRVFTNCCIGTEDENLQFIWKVMKEERCHTAATTPFIISTLCDYRENSTNEDSFLLEYLSTGGDIINETCKRAFGTVCKSFIYIGYGSTEMFFGTNYMIGAGSEIKAGNVGKPGAGIEVKIVDSKGDTVPVGQQGEIYTRSVIQSQGYFKDPIKTKELLAPGGWIKSGDIGIIDGENLIIHGRSKNVISRGTRKIIPAMVEDVIRKMKGLKEVLVIPVPDKRLGEEVCACFVSEDKSIDIEDVKAYCENHFLSDKTLDGIGELPKYFVKVDTLPTLPTGKYDKAKLRENVVSFLKLS